MDDDTNLDRLHDIELPPEVAAWPLALGWWVLIVAILALASYIGYTLWKRWQANAYRREALRDLESAEDVAAICEILRRCALAFTPRNTIAAMTGDNWVNWLYERSPEETPSDIRRLLVSGPYIAQPPTGSEEMLRDYTAHWIEHHQICDSNSS
ncbi:DUF4381 domain-containing protein [Bythopirellula goksoeyrii]|uniref:DUF4381 domain-containing protein n=1 Tax=Bythopirellula goksoeyrii TaxID=1400387 RepID=A0A5B9QCL4_9BACT|nr:DUF4381 domain-containing protein [Bythopirellula goksoeyrii]QEG35222.1 hypothetical protein Pr1d_25160 [Bythopirellula goksoeyrii]